MKSLCPSNRRSGLTLIELLVVVAIIGILVALLMPIIAAARQYALKAACIHNHRQIWYATQMSADDNGSYLPNLEVAGDGEMGSLASRLAPYVTTTNPIWHCPVVSTPGLSYSVNRSPMGREQSAITNPTYVIWVADGYVDEDTGACAPRFNSNPLPRRSAPGEVAYRHNNGAVFLFCDGHVDWVRRGGIYGWQWAYDASGAPASLR